MARLNTVLTLRYLSCLLVGLTNRLLKNRRSRKDWPSFDDAYLWYGEEAYEFNHSGGVDEYMDVLGTIMILETFHTQGYRDRLRRTIVIDRMTFKDGVMRWWLRQCKRGRPNLPFRTTYALFRLHHSNLSKTTQ